MTVSSLSAADPGAFAPNDPPAAPAGLDALARGDAGSPYAADAASAAPASNYATQLRDLTRYDNAELIASAIGTPLNAPPRAAAPAAAAAPHADPTNALNVPTYGSIIAASDRAAASGTTIDATA